MNQQIEAVKSEFQQASERLLKQLAATNEDKLNWSPSPTARTPLEIAFHSAEVIATLHSSIGGGEGIPSIPTDQLDAGFREQEKHHGSREEVAKKVQDSADAYVAFLEGLSEEKLAGIWHSPFGDIPVAYAISLPTFHTAGHIAQIEYIQTIYGDRVWH